MCLVDSVGKSGGLLSTWNPKVANSVPFLFTAGILLEGYLKDWEGAYKLINCYGLI